MGIVVAVFMLVGAVLVLAPSVPALAHALRRLGGRWAQGLRLGLLLAGLWNAGWYGLRHLGDFWGRAALVSGILMVAAALAVIAAEATPKVTGGPAQGQTGTPPRAPGPAARAAAWALALGLAASFCLYAVALVRLNLGWSVPGL